MCSAVLSSCAYSPNTTQEFNPIRNETLYSLKGNQVNWKPWEFISFDLVSDGTFVGMIVKLGGSLPGKLRYSSLLMLKTTSVGGSQETFRLKPSLLVYKLSERVNTSINDFPPARGETPYFVPMDLLGKIANSYSVHYAIETSSGIIEGDIDQENLKGFKDFYNKCSRRN